MNIPWVKLGVSQRLLIPLLCSKPCALNLQRDWKSSVIVSAVHQRLPLLPGAHKCHMAPPLRVRCGQMTPFTDEQRHFQVEFEEPVGEVLNSLTLSLPVALISNDPNRSCSSRLGSKGRQSTLTNLQYIYDTSDFQRFSNRFREY